MGGKTKEIMFCVCSTLILDSVSLCAH